MAIDVSTLKIEILEDGSIKTNAQQVIGTEAEILAELTALAAELGGELKVEKHVGGTHTHSHGGASHHHHGGSGHSH